MADPAPAAAPPPAPVAAEPAPAAKDPATSTAPVATKAPSIGDLKAARREARAAAPVPVAPATQSPEAANLKAQEAAKPDTATATIEMDAGALKQFTTLSRELRDAKAKAKELEAKVAGFGKFEKAQSLAKDGKHYDAAREAGIDVDAALAELLGNNNGAPASAAQIDKALLARIDALEAKDKAAEAKEADRVKADDAAAQERGRLAVVKYVGDNVEKYPHLAKAPDLVKMALKDADDVYAKVKGELPEGEDIANEEKNKILFDALEIHEQKWAKAFGAPKAEETVAAGLDASVRSGVRTPPAVVPKRMTFEELKAERAAKRSAARNA